MIRKKLKEKYNLRKQWQHYRSPKIKTRLNKTTKNLKKLPSVEKNADIQMYIYNFTSSEISDWKLIKKLKKPQQTSSIMKQDDYWARIGQKKADTFAEHLAKVFIPNASKVNLGEEEAVFGRRESTQSQMIEITRFTKGEIRIIISKREKNSRIRLNNHRILKETGLNYEIGFKLPHLFNIILRIGYFLPQ